MVHGSLGWLAGSVIPKGSLAIRGEGDDHFSGVFTDGVEVAIGGDEDRGFRGETAFGAATTAE